MGLKIAVASGNWSNPAIWNAGTLPQPGDVVASNGFTVTIDQNINVDSIINIAANPISSTPTMTGYTTPEGIVTSSSEYLTANGQAWKAFDKNSGTQWLSANGSAVGWIAYEFVAPKIIVAYTIGNPNTPGAMPRDFTFEAWNGSSWVVLHTVTGNLNTSTYTGTFTNTTAYIKYRINVTATTTTPFSYTSIGEFSMFVPGDSLVAAVAGGTFNMGGGVNVTCTGSIPGGATTVLTWNGGTGTTSSITTPNIFGANVASVNNVVLNGTGTLNISARIIGATGNVGSRTLNITNNGIINLVGNIEGGPSTNAIIVLVSSNCTFNITGTITHSAANSLSMLTIGAICLVNITGNIVNNATQAGNNTINISAAASVYVTGSVRTITSVATAYAISTGQAGLLSVVGSIEAGIASPALASTNASAINLFTGPFVCSTYGFVPFLCARAHLIPTTNSYFEFRDETTNGAVAPATPAPATQLVSPATVGDNPIPANVRFGTVYSLGTLTGTLRMPTANQVTYGVAVDNTFGNAVLTAASVWDYLVANITVADSIGMRLKNVATPQTVGSQLASLL